MCLILFAYDCHPNYYLVAAANRDEFYDRPTQAAAFWPDQPSILAGRDLTHLGTWLGLTRQGRFGALTNYRNPALIRENVISRGHLVSGYLRSDDEPSLYLSKVQLAKDCYNGFNLLTGDHESLYFYGNVENQVRKLAPGIYGLSNHLLDTPWTKVSWGKKALHDCIMQDKTIKTKGIFEILADQRQDKEDDLPQTGIPQEREKLLSSVFIAGDDYGTRSSAVITIDRKGQVVFIERTFSVGSPLIWEEVHYDFAIEGK